MVTEVYGKYTGDRFGELVSDSGLTANLYKKGDSAFKVFNINEKKYNVFTEALNTTFAEANRLPVASIRRVFREDGHWVLEMDYIRGSLMLKDLLDAIGREDYSKMDSLLQELAQIQYKINSLHTYNLPNYKTCIAESIFTKTSLSNEQIERLLDYLKGLPEGNCFIHGDFHPVNIIYSDGEPVILDWLTAGSGVSECDVARTYLNLLHPPAPWSQEKDLNIHGRYFSQYSKLSGITFSDVEKWFPVIAGMCCEGLDPVFNENMRQYLL